MQNLQEFTTNKSCPELSPDADSLYNSLTTRSDVASSDLLNHALSFPLLNQLSGSLGGRDSGNDPDLEPSDLCTSSVLDPGTMTTVEEETIEILSSCHVESVKSTPAKNKSRSHPVTVKLIARLEDHDPAQVNRKRVVRAVGVVTFLLLLFSVILIGISLNMSKSIDDMVRASRPPHKTYGSKKYYNRTYFEDS